MAKITYQPTSDDLDVTTVDGMTFQAYKPVDVDDKTKADLIQKLRRNPWFTDGEPDPDRQKAWRAVRDAQGAAKYHREKANEIEKHPDRFAAEKAKQAPATSKSA